LGLGLELGLGLGLDVMARPQWHAAIPGRRLKLAKPLPKSVTLVPPG